ncbi:hypothetical protein I2I11_13710 [Pontibacter sp. 172403-2]|uniref:hypothetical protein n=1 Tax=Pontibacter rufus TaxID=2791028 RepID=UPI0018AFB9D9|nr:hypothetical protein [Pontibacter sp. 172403-2]MBF9254357.1 hypothetical protein [Pontibacter sp. 172403-2]
MKPNYNDLGLSTIMGKELRSLVEKQLKEDLKNYGVQNEQLKFDWSESCIEGHDSEYLDGSIENFSGIAVYDEKDNQVADGWMEFINEPNFFIAYWDLATTWDNGKLLKEKDFGLPEHIWVRIPEEIRSRFKIGQ